MFKNLKGNYRVSDLDTIDRFFHNHPTLRKGVENIANVGTGAGVILLALGLVYGAYRLTNPMDFEPQCQYKIQPGDTLSGIAEDAGWEGSDKRRAANWICGVNANTHNSQTGQYTFPDNLEGTGQDCNEMQAGTTIWVPYNEDNLFEPGECQVPK